MVVLLRQIKDRLGTNHEAPLGRQGNQRYKQFTRIFIGWFAQKAKLLKLQSAFFAAITVAIFSKHTAGGLFRFFIPVRVINLIKAKQGKQATRTLPS